MVTIYKVEKANINNAGKFLVELRGLADDEKPTTINGGAIENGSEFLEIDTGSLYYFNEDGTEWVLPTPPEPTPDEEIPTEPTPGEE